LDQKSLHQSHLVGGRVPTSEQIEKKLKSNTQTYVQTLTDKIKTLEG